MSGVWSWQCLGAAETVYPIRQDFGNLRPQTRILGRVSWSAWFFLSSSHTESETPAFWSVFSECLDLEVGEKQKDTNLFPMVMKAKHPLL